MATPDVLDAAESEPNSKYNFSDEEDSLSVSSDESEISATQLATHTDYAVIWEILNCCQEAAFADIPSKYQHCLSIFNVGDACVQKKSFTEKRAVDYEGYDALFEVAGATKATSEPWSLPKPVRPLSDEDALWRQNVRVLEVSQVHPTAAIYLALDNAAVDENVNSWDIENPMTALGTFEKSMSPLVHATAPRFASAVFIAASHVFPRSKTVSFQSMRRYSRLAVTSLLRQAHALQIGTPIFGVLLRDNLVAIHVDWYEEHDGIVENLSAFYPVNEDESDIKTWDLTNPRDAQELVTILSNLRTYTYGPFASQVCRELGSVRKPINPWKWKPSCLSQTLSPAQIRQHSEEPPEDKINQWQKRLENSMDQATSLIWLKKKQATTRTADLKDLLSPPSTPGDVSAEA